MKTASKVELGAAVSTVVLAFFSTGFYILAIRHTGGPDGAFHDVLEGSVLNLGLPMLVVIGSYFHVIRGRIAGLIILLLSGLILAQWGCLEDSSCTPAAHGWACRFLPCLTAAVAVIAAVFVTRRRIT
jgi:hypothetical protein